MAIQPTLRWQFSVQDFARMGEVGIFTEDDRVELIDGEVIAMSPVGPRHTSLVKRLNALFSRQLANCAIISVQDPIQLTDHTEPLPDLAVLRHRDDFYADAYPRPEDVLLVVEVADSSLTYDLEEKVPRYAQSGIPEVWVLDVERDIIVQYQDSDGQQYRHQQRLQRGEAMPSTHVSQLALSVDDIFGPQIKS